jgi:hypothetical protein
MSNYNENEALWNSSPRWTRTGVILGLAVGLLAAVMGSQLGQHVGSCGLPRGVSKPGLAIELAKNWYEVAQIAGPCEASVCWQGDKKTVVLGQGSSSLVCLDKADALLQQQRLDYFFIPTYWSLFVWLALLNFKFARIPSERRWIRVASSAAGKIGGLAALFFATGGACWDYVEDFQIVNALNKLRMGVVASDLLVQPAMRDAAYHKWFYLFIAIACLSPLFFFWPGATRRSDREQKSLLSRLLAWGAGLAALSSLITGAAAFRAGEDQRLETAAGSLFASLMLAFILLMIAQSWTIGTRVWLDRLTEWKLFGWMPLGWLSRKIKGPEGEITGTET